MSLFKSFNVRLYLFLTLLLAVACSPVWGVNYFVNHDGSAHLYSASLMLELIDGNPEITRHLSFNSFFIPNASGHWILAALLLIFPPFTATKIIVTLTYFLFVCAAGWLRLKTVGRDGIYTSLLIGAVIGFNWLWFMGFYNFITGVIGFAFTFGLYYAWRENLSFLRVLMLSLILVFVYLSHIISFGVLAGTIVWLSFFTEKEKRLKTVLYTLAALLPLIPLLIVYKTVNAAGGGFQPAWNIADPFSISSWITQIRTADPLIIISRKSFPFVGFNSSFFALLTPALWLFVVFGLLTLQTFYKAKITRAFLYEILPFALLLAGALVFVVFAPDSFGPSTGWIFRERILLCALLFFIPIFRFNSLKPLKIAGNVILVLVILFQTAAVWEYAFESDQVVDEFLTASRGIQENDSIASVTIIEDVLRFHSGAELNMNNLNGLDHKHFVWDNYELAHFVFPIKTREISDLYFIRGLTDSNSFALNKPGEDFLGKLEKLEKTLSENHQKIDTLILWGAHPQVEAVLSNWFETVPYHQYGNARLFKNKLKANAFRF